jgi:hypothetical protein
VEGASDSKLVRRHSNDSISSFVNPAREIDRWNAYDCHAALLKPRVAADIQERSTPMSWLTPSTSIASLAFAQ